MNASAGWAYHPNGGRLAALHVPEADGWRLMERGWLSVDGQRAAVEELYDGSNLDGTVTLRVRFDEPYREWCAA